jgi:Xaa-Pro aminopeptidase
MASEAELRRRLARLHASMVEAGYAALIVAGNTEFNQRGYIRYLTDWRLYGGTGFLLLRPDSEPVFLLGLGAQAEFAAEACKTAHVRAELDKLGALADLVRDTGRIGVVGLDAIMSHGDARRLAAGIGTATIEDASPLLDAQWAALSDEDTHQAEQAHAIVANTFAAFRDALRPGRTEREVVADTLACAARQGCLEGIVNVSHAIGAGTRAATDRRFAREDIVKLFIEFLTPQGYLIELGGCFSFGPPPDAWCQKFELVANAIEAAIAATRPGLVADDIVRTIARTYAEAGAPVVGRRLWDFHGQGMHSLQRPFGLPGSQDPIEAGMMINIHPGLLTADGLGISATSNYLVTASGGRALGGFRHRWQIV